MPLCFTLLAFLSYIQYIHTFLHQWTFAEAPLHSLIADQLSGRHLPGVPSRDSNSGPLYSEPTCYQLSHAAPYWAMPHPTEPCRTLTEPWQTSPACEDVRNCISIFISVWRLLSLHVDFHILYYYWLTHLHCAFHLCMTLFISTWRFSSQHDGF